jgi:hypothetical protein
VVDAREALRGRKCAEHSTLGAQEAGHTQFQSTRGGRGRSCTYCAHEIGHSGILDGLGSADSGGSDIRYGRSFVSAKCVLFDQTAGSPSPRAVDCSAFRGRDKTTARGIKERPARRRPAARNASEVARGPLRVAWCGVTSFTLYSQLPAPWISRQLVGGRMGCSVQQVRSAGCPDPVIFRPFAEPQPQPQPQPSAPPPPPSFCDSSFPFPLANEMPWQVASR